MNSIVVAFAHMCMYVYVHVSYMCNDTSMEQQSSLLRKKISAAWFSWGQNRQTDGRMRQLIDYYN